MGELEPGGPTPDQETGEAVELPAVPPPIDSSLPADQVSVSWSELLDDPGDTEADVDETDSINV